MRRRLALVLGLLAAIVAPQAPPAASQAAPAPQAPAAAQSASSPAIAFASEAGMILNPITPAQAAVFEEAMQRVREALAKSADPVRQQQAAGWKIYKGVDPYQGATLYLSVMDPAVKGADYNVFDLLKESLGDTEARQLFEQLRGAYAGPMHVVSMEPFLSMGPVQQPAGK
jgi:hypothetical protein